MSIIVSFSRKKNLFMGIFNLWM